jgi:hypothetical protein
VFQSKLSRECQVNGVNNRNNFYAGHKILRSVSGNDAFVPEQGKDSRSITSKIRAENEKLPVAQQVINTTTSNSLLQHDPASLSTIESSIASTRSISCRFIDQSHCLCVTSLFSPSILCPYHQVRLHATGRIHNHHHHPYDPHLPPNRIPIGILMPSQHGFQFQLVAADGRCGLLLQSPGDAHHGPQ